MYLIVSLKVKKTPMTTMLKMVTLIYFPSKIQVTVVDLNVIASVIGDRLVVVVVVGVPYPALTSNKLNSASLTSFALNLHFEKLSDITEASVSTMKE